MTLEIRLCDNSDETLVVIVAGKALAVFLRMERERYVPKSVLDGRATNEFPPFLPRVLENPKEFYSRLKELKQKMLHVPAKIVQTEGGEAFHFFVGHLEA